MLSASLQHHHVPLNFERLPPPEQLRASRGFLNRMAARCSVRFISSEPVENAIRCASLAPSVIGKKSLADVMEVK